MKASYSKLTGKIVFDSKETGAASGVSFDSPLAQRLFAAKNNGLKLGDILDDSWFGPDGKVKLYSTASENIGSSAYKGVFTKESKLSDFLEAFNLKSSGVQLADSSSTTIVGNNTESLTGYGLRLEKVSPNPNLNIKITNGTTDGGYDKEMSISKFIDLVNNFGREQGRDATVVAKVNGEEVTLNRSSNTIDMDGMSVTFKESFNVQTNENGVFQGIDKTDGSEAIAFKTSSDADSVYKTVKEFVDSYNAILKEIHDAYATQPAEKNSSTHAKYEPLTDDDKSGMSESAIKSYEEKAKQGILFGDSDLSALYSRLLSVFSNGSNVGALRDMGITTTFSNGLTQISFNETKFREALDNDPDKVRDTFTKSKEYGAASDGIMTGIKSTLEQYASTSIATPGILVKKAGSTFSSNSLLSNTMQTQIDNVQKQIEKWQSKMSAKIDYYTRQFTALEKLMNTMNSQSSALAGLMGG